MKVLIFDRTIQIRYLISKLISQIDVNTEIETAESVYTTTELLNNNSFDIIIIDMDNIKGQFNNLRSLALKRNPNTTLIFLTQFPYKRIIEKFKDQGIDYFFDKLVEFDEFTKKLEFILNQEQCDKNYLEDLVSSK